MVYSSPTPSPPADTAGYFNRVSSDWSDKYRHNRHFKDRLSIVLSWILQGAPAANNPQLLDFGCGSGVFVEALVANGYSVTGVDASSGMIDAARQMLQQRHPGASARYTLAVVDGQTWKGPYTQRLYDVICCLGVLEYIEDDGALLTHLSGLLNPGGFLVLSVPNRNSLLRSAESLIHRNPALFKTLGLFPHLTGEDSYLHFQKHQYSLTDLTRVLSSQGLTLQKHRYHVTPGLLQPAENLAALGMTMIVLLRKNA